MKRTALFGLQARWLGRKAKSADALLLLLHSPLGKLVHWNEQAVCDILLAVTRQRPWQPFAGDGIAKQFPVLTSQPLMKRARPLAPLTSIIL